MPKTADVPPRLSVGLPPEDRTRLERLAMQYALSLNDLVVQAVREFLRLAATEDGFVLRIKDRTLEENDERK